MKLLAKLSSGLPSIEAFDHRSTRKSRLNRTNKLSTAGMDMTWMTRAEGQNRADTTSPEEIVGDLSPKPGDSTRRSVEAEVLLNSTHKPFQRSTSCRNVFKGHGHHRRFERSSSCKGLVLSPSLLSGWRQSMADPSSLLEACPLVNQPNYQLDTRTPRALYHRDRTIGT
jgi:hypothetical protein